MTPAEHPLALGKLLANLHSLEFCLRAFLHQLPGSRPIGVPGGTDIYTLPVGTELPENDLTSYESLGELIVRYNREVVARHLGEPISTALVTLRDALAHGRVSTNDENKPLRLLKFDRPRNGRVRITFNETMSETWFQTRNAEVLTALHQTHAAYKIIASS